MLRKCRKLKIKLKLTHDTRCHTICLASPLSIAECLIFVFFYFIIIHHRPTKYGKAHMPQRRKKRQMNPATPTSLSKSQVSAWGHRTKLSTQTVSWKWGATYTLSCRQSRFIQAPHKSRPRTPKNSKRTSPSSPGNFFLYLDSLLILTKNMKEDTE